MAAGTLSITYSIEGEVAGLRVPPPQPPRIADRLWEHTCAEAFITCAGAAAYHEFNFSPSGEWAAHAFMRYREGAILNDEKLNPRVAVRADAEKLELDASIRLDALCASYSTDRLALGLSAVIEDEDGALSYWALRHPPGKPDFHHPDGFALELDEIRN